MRNHGYARKRLSRTKIILLAIGVVLVYAGILLGVHFIGSQLESEEAPETVGSLKGRFEDNDLTLQVGSRTWMYRKQDLTNLLLIGVDWDDIDSESSGQYAGQADYLLLISIDRKNRAVNTLQIDRDTLTEIRIYGPFGDYTGLRRTQISLSHAYGITAKENCENTVWAVSHLLGDIPINGYLAMDMSSIAVLNDTLGGVTVTLEDDFTAVDSSMTKGSTITLHGQQAETYVRSRMLVGDGTNSARMRRQSNFIKLAESLMVEKMNDDLNFVGELFDALADHITTNIDRGWLINKAYECQPYDRPDTRNLAGSHAYGDDGFTEFTPDTDALNDTLTSLFFK